MGIYDLFSKRNKPLPDVFQTTELPPKFRTQVCWIWKDSLLQLGCNTGGGYTNPLMQEIRNTICREVGRNSLSNNNRESPEGDLMRALAEATMDTQLGLNVIETSFRFMFHEFPPQMMDRLIRELNHRFRENGIGYQFDFNAQRLIPVNSMFTHEQVVRPALAVLTCRDFATANTEFMEAFEDYKKSDFDDCLTKCCACFESVMKIICHKKGWAFDPKDTAAPLIQTIIREAGMESFFEQPLMLIATMRNRLSSSHGAGTGTRHAPEHIARYALNATASAILLLVEATGV